MAFTVCLKEHTLCQVQPLPGLTSGTSYHPQFAIGNPEVQTGARTGPNHTSRGRQPWGQARGPDLCPSAASAGDPVLPAQRGHLGLGMGTTCSSLWGGPKPPPEPPGASDPCPAGQGGAQSTLPGRGGLSWGNDQAPLRTLLDRRPRRGRQARGYCLDLVPTHAMITGLQDTLALPRLPSQPASLWEKPPAAPWSRARELRARLTEDGTGCSPCSPKPLSPLCSRSAFGPPPGRTHPCICEPPPACRTPDAQPGPQGSELQPLLQ